MEERTGYGGPESACCQTNEKVGNSRTCQTDQGGGCQHHISCEARCQGRVIEAIQSYKR